MATPITPKQVIQSSRIPDEVIEVFNLLILEHWDGKKAVIKVSEAADLIHKLIPNMDRKAIFDKGYLDIEDLYRKAGWKVVYDKPGFNESYPQTFTFSIKEQEKWHITI